MRWWRAALAAWAVLAATVPVHAQGGPAGAMRGTVLDASGGALPGVSVSARNVRTREVRTAVTNADGHYHIAVLPVGEYSVSFQIEGFKTVERQRVPVEAAVPRTVDASMEIGAIAENITVTADLSAIESNTAAVARQLTGEELLHVPSSTRNFTHLLTATPGVSADLPPVSSNDAGSISPSVNGTKTTSNSVLYNGVDVTSLLSNSGSLDEGLVPAPETLEEVKLQTSLYDASTGRSGGGNFQLVTRAGTNEFHGAFYGFGQHETLNSNDFFFDQAGLDKPKARRVETGFTLGGPLKTDRVFFFGSFQYTDAETGYVPTASSRALVPAALGLIQGERTAANIVAAFRQLNPSFNLRPEQISPLALRLLNARNPRTGDFLIPAGTRPTTRTDPRVAIGSFGTIGGDPLAELRQVVPSLFEQYQGSARLDVRLADDNRIQLSYFYGNFPSLDSFPDPTTMVSPFVLHRHNRGHVAMVGDTHIFSPSVVNDFRAGIFMLRNTRTLDDPFLDLEGADFGIPNPALLFDDRAATRRLGHFVDRGITWSFGGPNDSFNTREQRTLHFSDSLTLVRGNHNLRVGAEYKRHYVQTDLPEEQATEFEKIENFQQFLLGFTSEADTQFGFTQKQFDSQDVSIFLADDWRVSRDLTLNLGVRWDWFGWPVERDGFMGNFDPGRVTDPNNPITGLVVPAHARTTGLGAVDSAIEAAARTETEHTLAGQDLDNFAPRVGFAWAPGGSTRVAIRGGYGIFYDRPSAAFMNTVFSNYPHLREIEVTVPSRLVGIDTAFNTQLVNGTAVPFNRYFPFRLSFRNGAYSVFDGTGIGGTGNIAETLEFRAVDRDLRTPYYHHFNLGAQVELTKSLALEVRYNGSRGRNLLLATALNEPWDLNDPDTPRAILDRVTSAFRSGGGTPSTQDPQGLGYGYVNPATGRADNNFGPGGRLIPSEARTFYLGFNDREAIMLQSRGRSEYNALQVSLTRRWSDQFELHAAYTLSRSMDLFSSDPGSTAGSGRPDEANVGFSVENDSRDLESNWAHSDFDRRHRVSVSAAWTLPLGSSALARDWQIGVYGQYQSGRPFSVYAFEAGLLSLVFQRLDFSPGATEETALRRGPDPTEQWFDTTALVRANAAGNTPRNFLRGPSQKRVDVSLSKSFTIGKTKAEIRGEVFNLFDWVNYGMPQNNVASPDFGAITRTVGGPRVSQLGLRVTF